MTVLPAYYPSTQSYYPSGRVYVYLAKSSDIRKAADDEEVVVREIRTQGHGAYYYVVNTSMHDRRGVTVRLPARGAIRDLIEHRLLPGMALRLDLYPGELRSYRVEER